MVHRHRTNGCIHPAIISPSTRGVFLDHGDEVIIIADFTEQAFEQIVGTARGRERVALFQLGPELREFLDIGGQIAPGVPCIHGMWP